MRGEAAQARLRLRMLDDFKPAQKLASPPYGVGIDCEKRMELQLLQRRATRMVGGTFIEGEASWPFGGERRACPY